MDVRTTVGRGARAVPLLAAGLVAAVVAAVLSVTGPSRGALPTPAPIPAPVVADVRPNVVLVLLDDMSENLLRTMPSARRMRAEGASYPHSFVVDSLCCPSRSSTFTGQFPHQTGVRLNMSVKGAADARGGWPAFVEHGNEQRTAALRLQRSGYTTGFVGKYLNELDYRPGGRMPEAPPGWDLLDVQSINANDGWDFWNLRLVDGRTVAQHHPAPPESATDREKDRAYATTQVAQSALAFIDEHEDDDAPYFLQVAPHAPHSRNGRTGHYTGDPLFPAAFRDRPGGRYADGNCGLVACADLTLDDLPGWSDGRVDNQALRRDGTAFPEWRPADDGMTEADALEMLRDRAQMLQSVDRMVQRILDRVGPDTYVILTSDNGYHLGQYGMSSGKGTPYASDIEVPLLVVGPGVQPGPRREIVSNIDLAPTLERIAGLEPAPYRSGRSLLPSLADPHQSVRDYVFVEHTWGRKRAGDPDGGVGGRGLGTVPSYVAVRGRHHLLVRYDVASMREGAGSPLYAYEFYDLRVVDFERTNEYADAESASTVARMQAQLAWFDACAQATGDDPVTPACRGLGLAEAGTGGSRRS